MKSARTFLLAALVLTPAFAHAQAKPKAKAKAKVEEPAAPAKKTLADSLTGQAKADYEAGKAAYTAGQYNIAAAKFNDAYKASNEPRLLWNLGLAERQQQHYAKARSAIRQYTALTDDLSQKEKDDAQGMLTVLDTLVTPVTINVDQPDATITVDGETVGQTPLSRPIDIDNGPRDLRVTKPGHVSFEKRVQVAANMEPITVTLPVFTRDGRMTVRTQVASSAIVLDGKTLGNGTFSGVVGPGSHQLEVKATGYKPYTLAFSMAENGTRSFDVTLEKESRKVPLWAIIGGAVLVTGITAVVVTAAAMPDKQVESLPRGSFPPGIINLGDN